MKLTGITTMFILLLLFSPFVSKGQAASREGEKTAPDHPWALSLYGGIHASDTLHDIISFDADYSDGNNILVAGVAREVYRYRQELSFEIEGQIGRHYGDDVSHWEFVALGLGRWHAFPWDDVVNTSIAIGVGVSAYTEISNVERYRNEEAQRWLGHLAFELTFGLPQLPRWDLLMRLHHRSGMGNVIGEGSSEYVCIGLKYAF
ncbi:MAG: hypothetical protein N2A40_07300 [Desulfobulbaceae bacterium]